MPPSWKLKLPLLSVWVSGVARPLHTRSIRSFSGGGPPFSITTRPLRKIGPAGGAVVDGGTVGMTTRGGTDVVPPPDEVCENIGGAANTHASVAYIKREPMCTPRFLDVGWLGAGLVTDSHWALRAGTTGRVPGGPVSSSLGRKGNTSQPAIPRPLAGSEPWKRISLLSRAAFFVGIVRDRGFE